MTSSLGQEQTETMDPSVSGSWVRSLYTHDHADKFCFNILYRFADDIIIVGQISNSDEMEYRKRI